MKCEYCGAELSVYAETCYQCGKRVFRKNKKGEILYPAIEFEGNISEKAKCILGFTWNEIKVNEVVVLGGKEYKIKKIITRLGDVKLLARGKACLIKLKPFKPEEFKNSIASLSYDDVKNNEPMITQSDGKTNEIKMYTVFYFRDKSTSDVPEQ